MAPELSNLYTCPLQLFEHPSCRLHTLASDLKHSTPNRLPLFFSVHCVIAAEINEMYTPIGRKYVSVASAELLLAETHVPWSMLNFHWLITQAGAIKRAPITVAENS